MLAGSGEAPLFGRLYIVFIFISTTHDLLSWRILIRCWYSVKFTVEETHHLVATVISSQGFFFFLSYCILWIALIFFFEINRAKICIIYDFGCKFPVCLLGMHPLAFLLAVYESGINVGWFPESQNIEWSGWFVRQGCKPSVLLVVLPTLFSFTRFYSWICWSHAEGSLTVFRSHALFLSSSCSRALLFVGWDHSFQPTLGLTCILVTHSWPFCSLRVTTYELL